jgi:hypothetical protein
VHRFDRRSISLLAFGAITAGLTAVPRPVAAADPPAAGTRPAEAVDFAKARGLLQRSQRGEKLSADDQAYLDRAKAARARDGGGGKPPAAGTARVPPPRESTGLVPLPQLGGGQAYKGFDGGLYGGGRNGPPDAHAAAAAAAAAQVIPLDGDGRPDAAGGKVVLLSVGMSNTTQEFSRFKQLADRDADKAADVVVVDGAQGGKAADDWANDVPAVWQEADRRLAAQGVTPKQVQVVWVKQARKAPASLGEFPRHAEALQQDIEKILQLAKKRYPNLRLAYLSNRIYAGYATGGLNPEPYAYESAYAVRWVIQKQIAGDAALNPDPAKGEVRAPVVLWGPYLWADGVKGRAGDGLVFTREDLGPDGTHPSETGRQKVAERLLAFLKSDPTTKEWFVKR